MLTIRREQVQALAQAMFESWMADHLAEFFREEISDLDADALHNRIRMAVAEAHRYGFAADVEVCRYVDLTFILGPAFEHDPSLPWAAEILGDERLKDPAMRMDLLYEAAQDHVERIEQVEQKHEVGE